MRLVIDGGLATPDKFMFAETSTGVNVYSTLNGASYEALYKKVASGLAGVNISDLRAVDDVTDRSVTEYLTNRYPQPSNTSLSAIPKRYVLYSPMLSRLLFDLETGIRSVTELGIHYDDNDVIQFMIKYGYEDLFELDPLNSKNTTDDNYTEIHPSVYNHLGYLDVDSYKFVTAVKRIYDLDKLTDLSPFIRIKY
jgi:hypothetical protein